MLLAKQILLDGKFTDPAFTSIIQFQVTHFRAKCAFPFLQQKNSTFNLILLVFMKAKQNLAYRGRHLWCNWKSQGLILCMKTDVIFSWPIYDCSFLWVNKTVGKECGSNVSSNLLGRSRMEQNSYKGDYRAEGFH